LPATWLDGRAVVVTVGGVVSDRYDRRLVMLWADGLRAAAVAVHAAHGELLINATGGVNSLAVLEAAGAENLDGKVLIDVSNPLDFSKGSPPTLAVCNDDSVGEQIQRAFPETKVVKALNTMNAAIMVDPASIPGEHDVFMCGNDEGAKAQVSELLQSFGWPAERIVDLGGIGSARGQEMYLPLWLGLMGAFGPGFNIKVVH